MKKFLKPIFSKKILGILFLFMQITLIALTLTGIYDSSFYVSGTLIVLAVIIDIYEINRNADPSVKLVWIGIVSLVPLFGIFLYIYVHSDAIIHLLRRRLGLISAKVSRASLSFSADLTELKEISPNDYNLFCYLKKNAPAPAFNCGEVTYFPCGENMYSAVLEDIKSAEKYIFIEMFIINEKDSMWQEIEEIIIKKAKSGVEVRVIYDAMGSYGVTSNSFSQRLERQGISCKVFSPLKPFISTYHNNRDHRKIIIVDGKCAYTGGINIADEYINRKVRFGHWKDTAIRFEGSAVSGLIIMYFKMWNLISNKKDDYKSYFPKPQETDTGKGYICTFDDTPMDVEWVTKNVFIHILSNACDYVYINTPYLILGEDLESALKFAARRGVDVRITLPHIPDKWYAFAVGRTHYPDLLKAGVRIYEYTPGFIHAKSTVSDDSRVYIGSANYDFRSLYHNYECGAYIYGNEVAQNLKEDYLATLKLSKEFTHDDYKKLNLLYRLTGRVLKLFAPLL